MFEACHIPPLCRLMPLEPDADVGAETRRRANAGADAGTLLCAAREDVLDCAVILHPEVPLGQAKLALYVGALGLGAAVGAIAPPMMDVTYHWPNRIDAITGSVAEIDLILPDSTGPESVPDWLAVRVTAVIGPLPVDGMRRGFPRTSLRDDGCVDMTVAELLEAFARHFLTWINRWQDDGFEPVRALWLRHAPDHGETIEIEVEGKQVSGVFQGIDDDGALLLGQGESTRRVALDTALARPPG